MKNSLKTIAVILVAAAASFARGQVAVYDGITTPSGVQFPMSNSVVIGQQVYMDSTLLAANPLSVEFFVFLLQHQCRVVRFGFCRRQILPE